MMTADLKVTGRFDDAFAMGAKPMFERLAKETRDITVDMSEAADIDAAGLGALVSLHKRLAPQGLKVRVLGANDNLQRVFERFHVADLFIEGAVAAGSTAIRNAFFGLTPVTVIAGGKAANAKKTERGVSHGGASKRANSAVTRFDASSHSVKVWLDAATVSGGEIRGSDAFKSYRRWAKKMCQEADPAEFRKNLTCLLGADRIVPRRNGYVVRGIQFRSAIESSRSRLASAVRASGRLFAASRRMDAIAALSF
jgi:anti-anti-sigma regulatory factor